jgi:nucleotide-binding universal stress UspA family protein
LNFQIRSIVHPTDFSDLSYKALAHALRIALAAKCILFLVHVARHENDHDELAQSRLQRLLAQWQLLDEEDSPSLLASKLGVRIQNIRLDVEDPKEALTKFLNVNDTDLLVLATHGREGLERWLKGSIAETIFSRTDLPTLFVPMSSRGFVGQVTGDVSLRRVLVPVDHSPDPDKAIQFARQFSTLVVGRKIVMDFLHVGDSAPQLQTYDRKAARPLPVMLRSGSDVAQQIIDVASEFESDLICMTTAGHQSLLDALRGSTTERVLRHSPCPMLAIPAKA